MSEGESPNHAPVTVFHPGEAVWVWILGTWQPGMVVGSTEAGSVLARYRRLDGELEERAFPPSAVMEANGF